MLVLELTVPAVSTETLGDSPRPPRQREQLGEPGPLGKGSSRWLRDLRLGGTVRTRCIRASFTW